MEVQGNRISDSSWDLYKKGDGSCSSYYSDNSEGSNSTENPNKSPDRIINKDHLEKINALSSKTPVTVKDSLKRIIAKIEVIIIHFKKLELQTFYSGEDKTLCKRNIKILVQRLNTCCQFFDHPSYRAIGENGPTIKQNSFKILLENCDAIKKACEEIDANLVEFDPSIHLKRRSISQSHIHNNVSDLCAKVKELCQALGFEFSEQKVQQRGALFDRKSSSPAFFDCPFNLSDPDLSSRAIMIWGIKKDPIVQLFGKYCFLSAEWTKKQRNPYSEIKKKIDSFGSDLSENQREKFIEIECLKSTLKDYVRNFIKEDQLIKFFKFSSKDKQEEVKSLFKEVKKLFKSIKDETNYEKFFHDRKEKLKFLKGLKQNYHEFSKNLKKFDKDNLEEKFKKKLNQLEERMLHINEDCDPFLGVVQLDVKPIPSLSHSAEDLSIKQIKSDFSKLKEELKSYQSKYRVLKEEYRNENFNKLAEAFHNILECYRSLLMDFSQALANPQSSYRKQYHEFIQLLIGQIEEGLNNVKLETKHSKEAFIEEMLSCFSHYLHVYIELYIEKKVVNAVSVNLREWKDLKGQYLDYTYPKQEQDHKERLLKENSEILADWNRFLLNGGLMIYNEKDQLLLSPPPVPSEDTPEKVSRGWINGYIPQVEKLVSQYTLTDKKGTLIENLRIFVIALINAQAKGITDRDALNGILDPLIEKILHQDQKENLSEEGEKEFILEIHRTIFSFFGPIAIQLMEGNKEILNDPQIKGMLSLLEKALQRTNPEAMENQELVSIILSLLKFYRSLYANFLIGSFLALCIAYKKTYPKDKASIESLQNWLGYQESGINIFLGKETVFEWQKKRLLGSKNEKDAFGYLTQILKIVVPSTLSKGEEEKLSLSFVYEKRSDMQPHEEVEAQYFLRKLQIIMYSLKYPKDTFLTTSSGDNNSDELPSK